MFGLRMPELLLILGVVVLLFGGKQLPALGAALGGGIRSFRRAASGDGALEEGDPARAVGERDLPPAA